MIENRSRNDLPVSRKAAAALALMLGGMKDMSAIAGAVGLSVDEVDTINAADSPELRRLAVAGLPRDFYYRLLKQVVCPGCGARIFLVPCLACMINKTMGKRKA